MIIASPGCDPVRRINLSGTVLTGDPGTRRFCTIESTGAERFVGVNGSSSSSMNARGS